MHKADKFDRLGMIKKVTSLVEVVVIQPDKHVENKNSYKKNNDTRNQWPTDIYWYMENNSISPTRYL